MRKAVVCLVLLVFASCLRAEGYVYVLGPADTLTAVPDDAVAGWQIAADGVRLSLVSGKTLLVPEARKVVRECPVRLPRFSFFRYNDKHNDQLFQDVVASEADLLKDTVRLQVVQIGRYLTPTFGLTDSDAEAWIGLQRQESKVSRRNMAAPATYTLGRRCWRRLCIEDDGQGLTTYRYVPFGREVTVEVDFPTTSSTLAKVPCINITTKTGAVPLSKTSFISGTISIQGGIFPDMPTTDILIKGRGNSSWSTSSRSKNSYHFKFSEKQKPLGMKAGKHWVLLGNKQTGSMLCNAVGHKLSALAGCDAPCHIVPVELYINGTYRGSYNLTEKVGLKNNSVDLDDESCAAMLELDTYDDVAIFPDNAYRVSTKMPEPFRPPEPCQLPHGQRPVHQLRVRSSQKRLPLQRKRHRRRRFLRCPRPHTLAHGAHMGLGLGLRLQADIGHILRELQGKVLLRQPDEQGQRLMVRPSLQASGRR